MSKAYEQAGVNIEAGYEAVKRMYVVKNRLIYIK